MLLQKEAALKALNQDEWETIPIKHILGTKRRKETIRDVARSVQATELALLEVGVEPGRLWFYHLNYRVVTEANTAQTHTAWHKVRYRLTRTECHLPKEMERCLRTRTCTFPSSSAQPAQQLIKQVDFI